MKDRRFYQSCLVAFLLGTLICVILFFPGCNNPNHRPWRGNPESIQDEHWMDRYIWMEQEEAAARIEWEQTHPPKDVFDYLTR